jgi:hypothetical protein
MRSDQIVNAQGLREQLGNHLTNWKLARFRKKKLIPYIPLGHRTYLYNVEKVRAALDRLEVKEVA